MHVYQSVHTHYRDVQYLIGEGKSHSNLQFSLALSGQINLYNLCLE